MNIRIVNYTPSASPLVAAFVAVEIDGWLRFNGLNLLRDGTLRPAQLTPVRNGKSVVLKRELRAAASLRGKGQ